MLHRIAAMLQRFKKFNIMKKYFSDDKGRFVYGIDIIDECLCSIETLEMSSILTAAYHGFRSVQFNKPDGFCVTPLGDVFSLESQEVKSCDWYEGGPSNFIEPKFLIPYFDGIEDGFTEDYLFDFFMA